METSRWAASVPLRRRLVDGLRRAGVLTDERVAEAFLATPREAFLPAYAASHGLAAVYQDEAIPTKRDAHGRPTSSSSQPAIMALMIEAGGVRPGQRVLEIGAGTGYNAAVLSHLVAPGGSVVSVELDPETAEEARAALAEVGVDVEVVTADGFCGWAPGAPYDVVIATANVPAPPRAWHEQLAPGGRLVCPVRFGEGSAGLQAVVAFVRTPEGFVSERVIGGGFMPMRRPSDGAPEAPAPGLTAIDRDGRSTRHLSVTGPGLAPLGHDERSTLLATLVGPSRFRPLLPREAERLLDLLLLLPEERRVDLNSTWQGEGTERPVEGVGLVDPGGRAAAFVTLGPRGPGIISFGPVGDSARLETKLEAALSRWRKVRALGDLVVTVRYREPQPPLAVSGASGRAGPTAPLLPAAAEETLLYERRVDDAVITVSAVAAP